MYNQELEKIDGECGRAYMALNSMNGNTRKEKKRDALHGLDGLIVRVHGDVRFRCFSGSRSSPLGPFPADYGGSKDSDLEAATN